MINRFLTPSVYICSEGVCVQLSPCVCMCDDALILRDMVQIHVHYQ